MSFLDRFRRQHATPRPHRPVENSNGRFRVTWGHGGVEWTVHGATVEDFADGHLASAVEDQYIVLGMLAELDRARVTEHGFAMAPLQAADLSEELALLLDLPAFYTGRLDTKMQGNTTNARFDIRIRPLRHEHPEPYTRAGAMLTVGDDTYRLTPPLLKAFQAIEEFQALPRTDRYHDVDNVRLIAELQDAKNESRTFVPYGLADDDPLASEAEAPRYPLGIDLHHLDDFTSHRPDKVRLRVEPQPDGSLQLLPDLGSDVPVDALSTMSPSTMGHSSTVVRHGNDLVIMDPEPMEALREIRRVNRIPAERVPDFYQSPASFLDEGKVDLELHFSVRVKGIGALVPVSLAEITSHGLHWTEDTNDVLEPEALIDLAQDGESLTRIEDAVSLAHTSGSDIAVVDQHLIDVSDHAQVSSVLTRATDNVRQQAATAEAPVDVVQIGIHLYETEGAGTSLQRTTDAVDLSTPIDLTGLARTPFAHQVEGVEWMARRMEASFEGSLESTDRVQGAILADDMGLGKTFMALIALREFQRMEAQRKLANAPTLIVLPLTLIENWEAEMTDTFVRTPFHDVVVLQAARDLSMFRFRGAGRESQAAVDKLDAFGMLPEDDIQFSLAVGEEAGADRLDTPGRVVITTYETLASYQLSLAQVDWGLVIFDEAQRIKNPETLAARAAKGLKARFKLVATGTPVENSLRDLWSLMDTAQSGLLGTWSSFRQEWGRKIEDGTPDEQDEHGQRLADVIRPFMLRRLKDDHLHGLPQKFIHSGVAGDTAPVDRSLSRTMPDPQASQYQRAMNRHQTRSKTKGGPLKTLHALRNISLHPASLSTDGPALPDFRWEDSARVAATFDILDAVRERDEKALIFVINKLVQRHLAQWIHARYGVRPSIVNGETKAISTRGKASRRDLVQDFQARPGFGIIIMSPLAAGTGLTVTGANHAIHLERHWNPAKEAQATDRIYRIGQIKDVHIYLPMAVYPDPSIPSFDLTLHHLLQQKSDLKDAVVKPEVDPSDIIRAMGI
jgi:hypothetical protein